MSYSSIEYHKFIIEMAAKKDERTKNHHFLLDEEVKPLDVSENGLWVSCEEKYPWPVYEYEHYPTKTLHSYPCRVKTKDGRITIAVYVVAYSMLPNNDNKVCDWKGWVEMPKNAKNGNWKFIENIFQDKTIDVVQWFEEVTRRFDTLDFTY